MEKTGGCYQKMMACGGKSLLVLGCAVVLAAGPALAAYWNPLPDTGQTKCYDVSGAEIPCPAAGQPLHGQDAQYQGPAPSYTDNGNQTVTDNNTGLVWMKSDDGTTRAWQAAIDYCDGLSLAGQSDWRLPTCLELESIVDYSRNLSINPVFSCQSYNFWLFYWSATTGAGNPDSAWGVNFDLGWAGWDNKTNSQRVRCVRSGL